MKTLKNIFAVLLSLVILYSCNPLEDTYAELDLEEEQSGKDAGVTITYTLTADDYGTLAGIIEMGGTAADTINAEFVEDNEAFSTDIPAKDYLEVYVNDQYPQFNQGAAVQISYNFFNADIPDYDAYLDGLEYEVRNVDYNTLDGGFPAPYEAFPGNIEPSTVLPDILSSSVQDPSDGDIYFVEFNVAEETTVPDPDALFKIVESEDVSGFTVVDITFGEDEYQDLVDYIQESLGDDWIDSFGTLDFFYGSNSFFGNFDARVDEDNNGSSNNRKNWIADNNLDDDIFEGSTTYTEDSTRVEARILEGVLKYLSLTYPTASVDDNTVYNVTYDVFYGDMGNGFVTLTYNNQFIPSGDFDVIELTTETQGVYYTYDGGWEPTEGVIYLNASDYDAMGDPGRFNNFSSSSAPGDYIPEFLMDNSSFPQEGDAQIVVYRYFDGSTSTLAETYTFTDGEWAGSFIVEKTDQFVNDGTEFIFDPSVVIFMSSDDYQAIVDVVNGTNPDLVNSFGTGEDLYGADAFFENFDIRTSSKTGQADYESLSTSEQEALAIQRAGEGVGVFLEASFSDQSPVEGVDVFYTVNFDTFDGSDASWVIVYQLVSQGTFTLIEGPTQL